MSAITEVKEDEEKEAESPKGIGREEKPVFNE
jgi:hypothetical protein